MFAIQNHKGFVQQYTNGGFINEAQMVPELFSFIQSIVDESASGSTRVRIPISILGEIITGWRSILS